MKSRAIADITASANISIGGGLSAADAIQLDHLQAELARIDVLIRRQIRCWQIAGQDPTDAFRGLYVSDAEVGGLLAQSLAGNWGQMATLPPDEAWTFAQAKAQATRRVQALVEKARDQGRIPRLVHLQHTFDLDRFELDTLLICLAPVLDLRYERLYGYLQNDVNRERPTVNLVLDLLSDPGPQRLLLLSRFGDDNPLFKYRFLERVSDPGSGSTSLLRQTLVPDEAIVAWLLGHYRPHATLGAHASLVGAHGASAHRGNAPTGRTREDQAADATKADRLMATDAIQYLGRWCDQDTGDEPFGQSPTAHAVGTRRLNRTVSERPVFAFYGPDRASQEAAARVYAAQMNRPLLAVDLASVIQAGRSPVEALILALRDARLTGAIPYLFGWDACLAGEEGAGAHGGGAPTGDTEGTAAREVLAELFAHPDLVIVAGQEAWRPKGIDRRRSVLWLEFPVPAYAQRLALWQHFLRADEIRRMNEIQGGATLAEAQLPALSALAALAGQFALTSGKIRDAVASARDMAAQEGRSLEQRDLFAAARDHSNPRLSDLARKIVPRFTWPDIILPEDQLAILREIVDTVRGRPLVLEEWGVGKKLASSSGVTVLFSGPPGTGKTMAAEVIANELGLDLYKIDLSTVVSKYIGETEKNLERIFAEAQTSNAILFFDEADAIFGKRSEVKDAHDRYANIEISYLLQRMEMYDGVAILATNLRANLDEAFTRRLQFAVDLPFPEQEYRLRIWHTLFPPDVPRSSEIDFDLLASRFRLAGGNIRNIIVSAAYLAAADGKEVTMKHLLHGTRRELQKMGRLVNEADMAD